MNVFAELFLTIGYKLFYAITEEETTEEIQNKECTTHGKEEGFSLSPLQIAKEHENTRPLILLIIMSDFSFSP